MHMNWGDMTGKIFRLGQKVRVRVADADKMLKTVDFVLAEAEGARNGKKTEIETDRK